MLTKNTQTFAFCWLKYPIFNSVLQLSVCRPADRATCLSPLVPLSWINTHFLICRACYGS